MPLFYFALIAGGVVLFLNDTKSLNQLFTSIDTYTGPFKVATFMYITIMGMILFPVQFIDLSLIGLYAMVYFFVGVILYGLFKKRPLHVLKVVSLLHGLGVLLRLMVEWQPLDSIRLLTILIYAATVPLYSYIIQLILTLKRFSSND